MLGLEIVTPDRLFYSGEVEKVIARGSEGDLAILTNRSPITTPLKIGRVRLFEDGKEKVAAISEGYMSVLDNKVTIVTHSAEWPDEIDVNRAKEALKRAEDRLKNKPEGLDVARAELALKRALNRLDLKNVK